MQYTKQMEPMDEKVSECVREKEPLQRNRTGEFDEQIEPPDGERIYKVVTSCFFFGRYRAIINMTTNNTYILWTLWI